MNFRETDDQKIYISSDFHLNHNPKWKVPIYKMRGFDSAVEMTNGIIQSVNDIVRPNDILLFLGDWCLNTTVEQFDESIARVNCQHIYMLFGNHPNPHFKNVYKPMVKKLLGENYTENSEVYPLRYKNVIYIGHYAEVVLAGQFIVLCHYPISVWNEMSHGAWHLCGHSHNGFAQSKADNLYGKILDVGWDGHRKPWSFSEISAVMNGKRFIAVDEHHK